MTDAAPRASYGRRAFALYRRHHVERGIALIFKAVGLKRTGRLDRAAASLAWWGLKRRVARWQRQQRRKDFDLARPPR